VKDYRIGLDDIRHARRDKELQKYARNKKKTVAPAAVFVDQTGDSRGTVGAVHMGGCIVHLGGERRVCRTQPGLAVGDEVNVSADRVVGILPRTTTLSRPDPADPRLQRVIAANVDLVVAVSSVAQPPFRPGLIDRVLVAAQHGGAQPLICVNKIELRGDVDLSPLEVHGSVGVRVIRTSCITGEGIEELRAAIRARTCVFTGHSGVGKTSLLNALFPELAFATAQVGKKGRHTTTSSCLHEDSDGTRVIDTPGVREFGLWHVAPQQLRHYFPEFAALAAGCRFNDCTHSHEPDCIVRAAAPARYPQYLRLLGSLYIRE
jgi:ribosome biogenesis GTPase / thiamine phosphate phosphatase